MPTPSLGAGAFEMSQVQVHKTSFKSPGRKLRSTASVCGLITARGARRGDDRGQKWMEATTSSPAAAAGRDLLTAASGSFVIDLER